MQTAPPYDPAPPAPAPAAAAREAHAKLKCVVTTSGALRACHVLEERPVGYGFGAAAVRMAAYMRTSAPMRDGRPVGGFITVPFTFRVDADEHRKSDVGVPPRP